MTGLIKAMRLIHAANCGGNFVKGNLITCSKIGLIRGGQIHVVDDGVNIETQMGIGRICHLF